MSPDKAGPCPRARLGLVPGHGWALSQGKAGQDKAGPCSRARQGWALFQDKIFTILTNSSDFCVREAVWGENVLVRVRFSVLDWFKRVFMRIKNVLGLF